MDKGLGDVILKAVNGDNGDFEKFMENEFPIQLQKPVPKTEKYLVKSTDVRKLQKAKAKKISRPIVALKKEKGPCRCDKCKAKKYLNYLNQSPKTVNNVDPVKEARRQARKARLQVAKLKEEAREARRQTVELKEHVDPYAAVKARKIQEEQEERKFLMQNPHNGLAHKVRVMSGYSKPKPKRRRR